MHPRWAAMGAIVSQATGVIVGDKGKQPDIMVRIPRAAPLVIEAEFYPARSLENDALSRVGAQTANRIRPIETVVAVRYPRRLRDVPETGLDEELAKCDDLEWCAWMEGPSNVRFPAEGWVRGGLRGHSPAPRSRQPHDHAAGRSGITRSSSPHRRAALRRRRRVRALPAAAAPPGQRGISRRGATRTGRGRAVRDARTARGGARSAGDPAYSVVRGAVGARRQIDSPRLRVER